MSSGISGKSKIFRRDSGFYCSHESQDSLNFGHGTYQLTSKLSLMLTKQTRRWMGQSTLQWCRDRSGNWGYTICAHFGSVTLVVSFCRNNCFIFENKKRDSGKRWQNDGMRDSHKSGNAGSHPRFQTLLEGFYVFFFFGWGGWKKAVRPSSLFPRFSCGFLEYFAFGQLFSFYYISFFVFPPLFPFYSKANKRFRSSVLGQVFLFHHELKVN